MHPTSADCGTQPLRHAGHTPALYTYQGLPAFALLSLAGSVGIELTFEFKKLTDASSSLAIYRGKNGMQRFVDGDYARGRPLAAMVGLIKDDSETIVRKLCESLSKPKVREKLKMIPNERGDYTRRPSGVLSGLAEFDTEHDRPAEYAPAGGTITVVHLLFVCPR